ncbi:hypothetical protein HN51_017248 [Arachis hypogaea]|uniref:Brassinosteroid-related acyltransferase n=1 Tax=Arachis hypogaea TaxID=3818 RepID=A0A445CWI5_ARAHY|nr:brassinosteroid-related acyltransferase 1 [Arachis ipaensis]XP_025657551.1 brassinosteroid-related acyltransferase 1 [Arachis hypogaea]QHN88935.1 Omega-hydroxypalmitate O-feruloyl transferase [Arachis hypogaea]RYR55280.1 hypothetical protein Ahy_A06g030517 [Arachis hypogaea]
MATPHDENNGTVSISRVVCVHPKIEQPHRVLSLSNLDRQCPRLMQLVFFYNNLMKNDLSLNSVFNSLKIGLEETLIMWYPGAGRLMMMMNPNNNNNNNNNNQSDGKLNLWCNNEGAILVEAETKARISQLGDLSQYNEFFENLVYKPDFDPNFSNMPLIVAQVTKFGCGGYSIGIGTSHSLFDGPATYDFLYAWASNSEIMKAITAKPLELPKPVHERGILLSSGNNNKQQLSKGSLNLPSSSNFYAHDEHNNQPIRAMAVQHLYQLIMQATAAATLLQSRSDEPSENNYQEKWVLKTYHLSAAMIDNLKRKYLSSIKTGSLPFSTFEVLTAHLWKARTKALGLSKEKVVCLQFAVDTRNKMVPPLPKGFSGNAYVLASLMMSVSQLLDHSSHELIIEKIREAKNAVNHSYVKSYIDALELGSNNSLPPLKELTLVSDWTRMPFHNIEFFHGRKAAYASPLATPVPQVAYFMQSPFDVGGVDLRIGFQDGITLSAFTQCFLT